MRILVAVLLVGSALAADTSVVVKAVNMETGAAGAASYTYHSMIVEVDGTTYKISRPFVRHETWLHKGTYMGRWKGSSKRKLEVDLPESGKMRHVEFSVLGEE